MVKHNQRIRQRIATGTGVSDGATATKLTTPTSGLEDVYFTRGATKDATKFEDTLRRLPTYKSYVISLGFFTNNKIHSSICQEST